MGQLREESNLGDCIIYTFPKSAFTTHARDSASVSSCREFHFFLYAAGQFFNLVGFANHCDRKRVLGCFVHLRLQLGGQLEQCGAFLRNLLFSVRIERIEGLCSALPGRNRERRSIRRAAPARLRRSAVAIGLLCRALLALGRLLARRTLLRSDKNRECQQHNRAGAQASNLPRRVRMPPWTSRTLRPLQRRTS